MIVHLTSTSRVVEVVDERGGIVPGRVWEGTTESGIQIFAVITRIAVREDRDLSQFEAELERKADHHPSPESFEAIPSRLIL